ncbi:MAG: zinc-ribbon domain containing protein [Gammaproteobacteria bacterium]|nr:zinc-ribbon domain containing protein [Gammaproteobacteria bacterium]
MPKDRDTGRSPTSKELRDADRIANLPPTQQKDHPSAVPADPSKLDHINTYGQLPEFYIDRPFSCRQCGKREIWRARDQKWYYEEAKGHIDAVAVECHDCRKAKKAGRSSAYPTHASRDDLGVKGVD